MPSRKLRNEVLGQARRIVVKLGTQLLTDPNGSFDVSFLQHIADQLARLIKQGVDVTLVSSGAVGVGRMALQMNDRPTDLGQLQAVAAIGQSGLMQQWHQAFEAHGIEVAQILLTRGDFEDRDRYLNLRNCINELHQFNAVPIINENDTVSVEEIRLGDNDILAALVANTLRADALILLTVSNGVHDADGNTIEIVDDVNAVTSFIRSDKSSLGTGGMQTKIDAAMMVTQAGEIAVIANGRDENIVERLFNGENLGTVFVPADRKLTSRRRWIGMTKRPCGSLVVDEGAVSALTQRGKSLLASGIVRVDGEFEKGDVVTINSADNVEVARGLINYDAEETRRIMGNRSGQFQSLLGHGAYDEVIHRDNMVVRPDRRDDNHD